MLAMPKIFDDGCVLQSGQDVPVWGWCEPRRSVTVTVQEHAVTSQADEKGAWKAVLPSLNPGGPFTMVIECGTEQLTRECYVGEVFLCSGQSNMELPMQWVKPDYPSEFEKEPDSLLRQYKVVWRYDFNGPVADHEEAHWAACDADGLPEFSAAAYFFAKHIRQHYNVPVGLLNVSLGGSPIESWLDWDTLQRFSDAVKELEPYLGEGIAEKRSADSIAAQADWLRRLDESELPPEQWQWCTMNIPDVFRETGLPDFRGRVEFRKTVYLPRQCDSKSALLRLGLWMDSTEVFVNGRHVGSTTCQYEPLDFTIDEGILHAGANEIRVCLICETDMGCVVPDKSMCLHVGDESFDVSGTWRYAVVARIDENRPIEDFVRWKPVGLYNAMLAPCIPYGVRAALWYQGESNTGERATQYHDMLAAMINLWRCKWAQKRMPFLIVQLPVFSMNCLDDGGWPLIREAEWQVSQDVNDVATVVTLDAGAWNDLHPYNKQLVGTRLFEAALSLVYGENTLQPAVRDVTIDRARNEAVISFVHVPYGTKPDDSAEDCAMATLDGGVPEEFEYVWSDGGTVQAMPAIIDGNTVHVALPPRRPESIRYAWGSNPHRGLLCDEYGIPVTPFRIKLS